jgi:hypothetical protein
MTRLLLLLPLALAGCAPILFPGAGGTVVQAGVSCPAGAFESLVGQPASVADYIPQADVPMRVLEPGQSAGTPDPSRITLRADAAGRIAGVECS